MRTPVDDQLLSEVERFALRFECEHCAHFDPATGACSAGFPNAMHRVRELSGQPLLIIFCKSFELL